MKEALDYIAIELRALELNIESFNAELDKTDLIVSSTHWQTQIQIAQAVRNELLTIKTCLNHENN